MESGSLVPSVSSAPDGRSGWRAALFLIGKRCKLKSNHRLSHGKHYV